MIETLKKYYLNSTTITMASMSSSSELLNEEIEIQSLQKSFIKTTKKSNYGSLRKDLPHATTPMINYKHKLKPGETLQGISLKYNVPIESIKRANRLWSNDLAFLKDVLIVPLRKEKYDELNLSATEEAVGDEKMQVVNEEGCGGSVGTKQENNKIAEPDFKDYLNKFDSLINESKIKFKSLESNTNLSEYQKNINTSRPKLNGLSKPATNDHQSVDDDDDLFQLNKRLDLKKANSISHETYTSQNNHNHNHSSKYDSNNLNTVPEYQINDPNSGANDTTSSSSSSLSGFYLNGQNGGSRAKLAHKNLQRLEKEKDELFEL